MQIWVVWGVQSKYHVILGQMIIVYVDLMIIMYYNNNLKPIYNGANLWCST